MWDVMNKIEIGIDTSKRLAAVGAQRGVGDWLKEGEWSSGRTYLHDSMTRRIVWGLSGEVGLLEVVQWRKGWEKCSSIYSKNNFLKHQ